MRVLQLGAGNLFGGIEVCQLTLARYRHACPDLEQEYAYCFSGKAAADVARTGVPVHVLGGARYSRPWSVLAARRALARLLRGRRYDVVVCHEVWVHGIFASTARAAGTPLVLWVHDRHGAGGHLEFFVRRSPPGFMIANSSWSAESLPGFLPAVPYRVIYCPVEADPPQLPERRAELRRQFGASNESIVILQVGRWEPHKGHVSHVEALAAIRDIPGWTCWQVGAPQRPAEVRYRDDVRDRAVSLGIGDRVKFLGWQEDLAGVRSAADIYCQPNVNPEPFGLTIVEALSAGLPVVAAAQAGPLEIVTADCGVLTAPGETSSLAAALRHLCTDDDARQRMSARGPARARLLCDPPQQVNALATWLADGVAGLRAGNGGRASTS